MEYVVTAKAKEGAELSNIQVNGDGVIVIGSERTVYIKGKTIKFHPNMKGNNVTTINGKVYIDGFEYKNRAWKRTLKAFLYKWF